MEDIEIVGEGVVWLSGSRDFIGLVRRELVWSVG